MLLVEDELWKAVPASAAALRDKTVFVYDRGKLERVELESPKGKVALALQDGKWRITAPVALRADEGAVSELLFKARDLRARDFVAEDAKRLAAYGLDKPQIRLSVWEKEAKEPKILLLAPAREKDRAYATALGQGAAGVVAVDATALAGPGARRHGPPRPVAGGGLRHEGRHPGHDPAPERDPLARPDRGGRGGLAARRPEEGEDPRGPRERAALDAPQPQVEGPRRGAGLGPGPLRPRRRRHDGHARRQGRAGDRRARRRQAGGRASRTSGSPDSRRSTRSTRRRSASCPARPRSCSSRRAR